jgi:hypothetical protein
VLANEDQNESKTNLDDEIALAIQSKVLDIDLEMKPETNGENNQQKTNPESWAGNPPACAEDVKQEDRAVNDEGRWKFLRQPRVLLAGIIILLIATIPVMTIGSDDDADQTATLPFAPQDQGATFLFTPLSDLDPVTDVGLPNVERPAESQPSSRLDPLRKTDTAQALPTNAWYQSLLMLQDEEPPTSIGNHRVYTVPYVIDVVGAIPGMRVHRSFIEPSPDQVIVSISEKEAVTLGAAMDFTITSSQVDPTLVDKGYNVVASTDLGITLEWVRSVPPR